MISSSAGSHFNVGNSSARIQRADLCSSKRGSTPVGKEHKKQCNVKWKSG